MSKRVEDLAKELFPDPRIEDYDDILVYRADRDNAIIGRIKAIKIYEQAEKDIISIIQSRLEEICGDAQPRPILRAELQELMIKIMEVKI